MISTLTLLTLAAGVMTTAEQDDPPRWHQPCPSRSAARKTLHSVCQCRVRRYYVIYVHATRKTVVCVHAHSHTHTHTCAHTICACRFLCVVPPALGTQTRRKQAHNTCEDNHSRRRKHYTLCEFRLVTGRLAGCNGNRAAGGPACHVSGLW